jgi:hypothetical protein
VRALRNRNLPRRTRGFARRYPALVSPFCLTAPPSVQDNLRSGPGWTVRLSSRLPHRGGCG